MAAAHAVAGTHDLGWILLAFAIFNTYMLIYASALNGAIFTVFLTLELTEIVLFIGFLGNNANIIKVGGYIGIITALCRLVHLSGRRDRRHQGQAPAAGRQAVRAARLTAGLTRVIPGTQQSPRDHCIPGDAR